ncbi:MAG TPA: PAS domain S-box protein, partial [Clostridia bacterium]|nr:PAS domain S-box protein [Clostridia bacterium]
MKVLLSHAASKLREFSPTTLLVFGILYELALLAVDYATPDRMNFGLFYLLGVAFVGWGVGRGAAAFLALFSAVLMAVHEWPLGYSEPFHHWTALWNVSARFLVFLGCGWLAAEVTRLTRNLSKLVEQRTAQWKSESERHQETAARLAEREQRYRAILATAMDGFAMVDTSGRITEVNKAYCQMVGYKPTELVGMHITGLDVNQSPEEVASYIANALQHGGARFETAHRHKSGHRVELEVSVSSPAAPQREFVVFARDITQRQQLEKQILEISDREQARIGQEIHDGLCQQLVSLAFDANSLEYELAQASRPESRHASRLAQYLDDAISEARR